MLQVAGFEALADHVAGRAAPSGVADPEMVSRRRDVALTHLATGVLPFATLPALLAFGARPSAVGLAAFALMAAPIMAALDLSRSGALDRALIVTATAFAGLVALVASVTGGLASPALALLLLPLIDSALAGARRGLIGAAVAAAAAVVGLVGATLSGRLPSATGELAPALAVGMAAGAYALAQLARTIRTVKAANRAGQPTDAAFERFAATLDDLITRHEPSGAVTFASGSAREIFAALPRELAGQGLFQRVHIADRPAFLQALASAADGAQAPRVEIRIRHGLENGVPAFRWIEMRARRIGPLEVDAASAQAAPVVASFRDVDVRKAHEEALAHARLEAETARLAKTRFLAHMSHELRTPLNAIIGFSEALADEALSRVKPERRADYAALIHRSGVHLLEVVNSILDMAKIESGSFAISPRACAIAPLVEQSLALMAMKADTAGVLLATDFAPDAPDVDADPRAITQVVLNLVANAIKFTPVGGVVTVALKAQRGGVGLTVRDTGCGVAPEHLARLGEAFYQVEDGGAREGAGLGLSVVRSLVALHGGEMSIESAIGRGTTVAIHLPPTPGVVGSHARIPDLAAEKVRLRA